MNESKSDLIISIEDRLTYFINRLKNLNEGELNNINENLDILLSCNHNNNMQFCCPTIAFPLDISKESDTLTKECIEALFLGYTIKKLLI